MVRVTALLALSLLIFSASTRAQESQRARSIYEQHSNSVVLLLARDATGKDVALGSAFWVAPKLLVTNAHIVDAGKTFVQLGPVRLPCTIVAVDHQKDLATLSVDADVDTAPLKLSSAMPKPGDPVFVIGNPEGLEKAISQGIVSGIRKLEDEEFIQITAPISHGSSGGPVFDEKGEVIGVTVGMLQSGQNLNFAIPVRYVADLLAHKTNTSGSDSLTATMARLQTTSEQLAKLEYSGSPDSEYQQSLQTLKSLARVAINESANNVEALLKIAEITDWIDVDLTLDAARRACSIKPSVESHLALVRALEFQSLFLKDPEKSQILAEEESHAASAVYLSTKNPRFDALFALGDVQADRGEIVASEQNLKKALLVSGTSIDQKAKAYRSLARVCAAEGKSQESEQFFEKLVSTGKASGYDWDEEGDRLVKQREYRKAADAYSKAADAGIGKDRCYAAANYWYSDSDDLTLAASRQCISDNTGKPDTDKMIGYAHSFLASVLDKRGLYSEALGHAKEATVLNPEDADAFNEMAQALIGLQRYHEAIPASQEALRLSDGKYSSYHFTLADAYFDLENWQLARQSYEKAAELNPKSFAAAFNVGLCFIKQGFYRDGARWYEEALKRDPNNPKRADMLRSIEQSRR